VVGTKPSVFGKEYMIAYLDGSSGDTPTEIQPWTVVSLAEAEEKGWTKPPEEKPKKDLGNFVEGTYVADEIALLIDGEFNVMKFEGIKDNSNFKKLDDMLQFAVGMLSATAYNFDDGEYAQKALMGGYGLWREYEVDGDKIIMPDQKETITMSLLKDGRIQHKTASGMGQELFITYVKE